MPASRYLLSEASSNKLQLNTKQLIFSLILNLSIKSCLRDGFVSRKSVSVLDFRIKPQKQLADREGKHNW